MHAVNERVEKEAEDDPGQHQSGLDQQPPVGDVILQQQHHFSDTVNHALEWETFASVNRDILSGFFIHEKKMKKPTRLFFCCKILTKKIIRKLAESMHFSARHNMQYSVHLIVN